MKESEFRTYFNNVSGALEKIDIQSVEKLVDLLLAVRDGGNTIFLFGNGGSAATASHITGDFIKGISYQLEKRFRVICLNDNISGMMAISNDLSYDEVFVEQLRALMQKDDLVIGISGSGNSVNVVKAIEYARDAGARTVAFCGFEGGKVRMIAEHLIHIPVNDMEITEDIHIIIFHAIKQSLMRRLRGPDYSMGEKYDERVKVKKVE
ncbi:MAG: SIS domain-containing protein [Bacteroidales bacterium]|nr:SIS domain-containing protein [Bacteroidales bacterium]